MCTFSKIKYGFLQKDICRNNGKTVDRKPKFRRNMKKKNFIKKIMPLSYIFKC